MNTNFDNDLKDSQELHNFLDNYFYSDLTENHNNRKDYFFTKFKRNDNLQDDFNGIDLILYDQNNHPFYIDEKATLDYKNNPKPLSTFAFELGSIINNHFSEGWLTNPSKKTNYYVLIWPHQNQKSSSPVFDFAEIMIIKRSDVLEILNQYKDSLLNKDNIIDIVQNNNHNNMPFKYIQNSSRFEYRINKNIKLVHSLGKTESPLNVIISKELLVKKSGCVFWVTSLPCKCNVMCIKNYTSPRSFEYIINKYFQT